MKILMETRLVLLECHLEQVVSPWQQSLSKGVYETYNLSVKTLQFIGKMLTGNMGTENLSGPIGIAQMAGNTAQAGFLPFMYLMALLSISLGV